LDAKIANFIPKNKYQMQKRLFFANFKTIIADFEKTTPQILQIIKAFYANVTNGKIQAIESVMVAKSAA
jgi:hypothetical protein